LPLFRADAFNLVEALQQGFDAHMRPRFHVDF
jgi:hypothetical protein